jgi:acetyl esterase/lipase
MKISFLFLFSILLLSGVSAQDKVLKVWPEGALNDNGMTKPEETFRKYHVRNVSEAVMYVYLPPKEKNTGVAIVICPGGGYSFEAMDYEGYDIAKWLNTLGITGVVLKYRLPYGHADVPSSDGKQAIRIIRENAKEWGINPKKVGIAGFSAGGHLASTVGTHFDYGDKNSTSATARFSSRPDFMLLLYPVISLKEEFGHMGSRINLIGKGNNWELVKEYSNELQVTPETPPAFIAVADDDELVPARNSVEFYLALNKNSVPAELHVFAEGQHGFFLKKENLPVRDWPNLFYNWLKAMQIVEE